VICLEWRTSAEDIRRTRAVTCDLSFGGVYAYVRHSLEVNLTTEFDIAFPSELTGELPTKFRCSGSVTRCERIHGIFGIGIAIRQREVIEDRNLYRRASARVRPAVILTAEISESRETGFAVRDITRAGAFIETSHPLPVGERMRLLLRKTDLPLVITVTAVVRRSKPTVGMGVEFVEVGKEADRLLRLL
jgi:hypothetical protein